MEDHADLNRSLGRLEGKMDLALQGQEQLRGEVKHLSKRLDSIEADKLIRKRTTAFIGAAVGSLVTLVAGLADPLYRWFKGPL